MATDTKQVALLNPSEHLEQIVRKSLGVLSDFLESDADDAAMLQRARIASGLVASWTRNRQVDSARESLNFQMARELARDKEELRKYIEVSMPASGIVRALPSAKEK